MSEPRIVIRKAQEEDCESLLELIKELAIFEKAPQEVSVTLEHFKESGFSSNPVWWALVACVVDPETQEEKIIGMAFLVFFFLLLYLTISAVLIVIYFSINFFKFQILVGRTNTCSSG